MMALPSRREENTEHASRASTLTGSVAEHLPPMCEVLGSVSATGDGQGEELLDLEKIQNQDSGPCGSGEERPLGGGQCAVY